MIIHFEAELRIEPTTHWAITKERESDHHLNPIIVDVSEGTPGQKFHGELMRHLFAQLDMLK